jgi:CubicO group peptidase (beta-lactamase class C family)
MIQVRQAALFGLAIALSACGDDSDSGGSGGSGGASADRYPDPDWAVEAPEDHGFDTTGLQAVADYAQEQLSKCLVVTRNGVIVGEWYFEDFDASSTQIVFSVTKSFTSSLVGIAHGRGELSIDDSASKYISAWKGTPSEPVTVKHLLSNVSGRYWEFQNDYVKLAGAPDATEFAIALPEIAEPQQHPPDTYWEYNNTAIQTLEQVLETATGKQADDYAREHLFDPIGMNPTWDHDTAGNPLTYTGLHASCRDLARFGYLYLKRGRWAGGAQIVPEAYVAESTATSSDVNAAYGYLWWVNQDGHWVLPSAPARSEGDGPLIPDAPIGAFAALGLQSQIISVDPSAGVVVTRIGGAPPVDGSRPAGGGFFVELTKRIVAARKD